MDLNLNGVRIGETSAPNTYRPIVLPFHNQPINHFSMDIGGSLAKLVYFEPNEGEHILAVVYIYAFGGAWMRCNANLLLVCVVCLSIA